MVTGGINGLLSPIVNGIGNAFTKATANKLGLKVVGKGIQQTLSKKVLKISLNILQHIQNSLFKVQLLTK